CFEDKSLPPEYNTAMEAYVLTYWRNGILDGLFLSIIRSRAIFDFFFQFQVLLAICSLLTDPTPMIHWYPKLHICIKRTGPSMYEATARFWTQKYAMG
ncbi:hypothetical protein RD792_005450, partial [Penstemon davidsonii]